MKTEFTLNQILNFFQKLQYRKIELIFIIILLTNISSLKCDSTQTTTPEVTKSNEIKNLESPTKDILISRNMEFNSDIDNTKKNSTFKTEQLNLNTEIPNLIVGDQNLSNGTHKKGVGLWVPSVTEVDIKSIRSDSNKFSRIENGNGTKPFKPSERVGEYFLNYNHNYSLRSQI